MICNTYKWWFTPKSLLIERFRQRCSYSSFVTFPSFSKAFLKKTQNEIKRFLLFLGGCKYICGFMLQFIFSLSMQILKLKSQITE